VLGAGATAGSARAQAQRGTLVWLYLPATLVPSVASGHSTSLSDEYFRQLAACSTWRTSLRAPSAWRRVWRTEPSIRRLCGPTFGHSQTMLSEAVSTWWSEAFPARISASPARAKASAASDLASGSTSSDPFARYDHGTSSWKTLQPSLFEDWTPSSPAFPKAGSMRSGAVYERPTLVRRMAEIAGGALRGTASNWPTPRESETYQGDGAARAYRENGFRQPTVRNGQRRVSSTYKTTLTTAVMASSWPTPNAGLLNYDEQPEPWRARAETLKAKRINGNGAGLPLGIAAQEAVSMWSTPRSSDGEKGGPNQKWGAGGAPLPAQAVRLWGTPGIADTMGGYLSRSGARSDELLMKWQAQALASSLSGHPAPASETPGLPSSRTGRTLRPQLSALFVEWLLLGADLLGWTCVCAIEATACADSATPSVSDAPRPRSDCSGTARSESGHE
jgi:hypothetical protein